MSIVAVQSIVLIFFSSVWSTAIQRMIEERIKDISSLFPFLMRPYISVCIYIYIYIYIA